jgi:aldehyde dehydrogenase (NAD+)
MDGISSDTRTWFNHIGGRSVEGAAQSRFEAFNPTTGGSSGDFVDSTAEDVDAAVRAAADASRGAWAALSASARGRLLMRWGDEIFRRAEEIGRLETEQNGKLLAEMRASAAAACDWLYYFGGLADKVEGRTIPVGRTSVLNYTLREPLGVVGVIVPWNSPTLLAVMSMAPALAAGNTVVLKPSEVTPASALELARLAEAAGIPSGVVNVVTGGRSAGEALVDHPLVAKICFAGSDAAGAAVAERAGRRLAGCALELGGKSPNIVFADADLDRAIAGVFAGIFAAAGQTCVAGSRAFIHADIYEAFVARLVSRATEIRLGDPLVAATQMGPVASRAQFEKNCAMTKQALEDGGALLCGGEPAEVAEAPRGLFFKPTILADARPDSRIMQHEVFGPVLCVTPFSSDDEVVALANGTRFGLAAGIWTNDLTRAHATARQLGAGTVWINTYRALACNSPFGGYKASGLGRLNGVEAIEGFLQTKSVWCELSSEVQDPFVIRT